VFRLISGDFILAIIYLPNQEASMILPLWDFVRPEMGVYDDPKNMELG
jgi:hypothetical protein